MGACVCVYVGVWVRVYVIMQVLPFSFLCLALLVDCYCRNPLEVSQSGRNLRSNSVQRDELYFNVRGSRFMNIPLELHAL